MLGTDVGDVGGPSGQKLGFGAWVVVTGGLASFELLGEGVEGRVHVVHELAREGRVQDLGQRVVKHVASLVLERQGDVASFEADSGGLNDGGLFLDLFLMAFVVALVVVFAVFAVLMIGLGHFACSLFWEDPSCPRLGGWDG